MLLDSIHPRANRPRRDTLILSTIAAVGAIGLGLSIYLTWTTWNATSVAGCGGSGMVDCDQVLASRWSKWIGLPVSLFGVVSYVGILTACVFAATRWAGIAANVLLTLSLLAAGSATWFTGLQVFLLQSFCLYCLGVHICSFAICTLTVVFLTSISQTSSEDQMRGLLGVAAFSDDRESSSAVAEFRPLLASAIAALGLLLLMGGQLFYAPAGMVYEKGEGASTQDNELVAEVASRDQETTNDIEENPQQADPADDAMDSAINSSDRIGNSSDGSGKREPNERFVQFTGLKKPIDVADMPILGSPHAQHVVVEMLDYTCHHCRDLHPHVHAALERYGDQIAFVILPVPLSKRCNPHVKREHPNHKNACEYARLAINTWKLEPDKFAEIHNWLMESEKPPTVGAAKSFALNLVGKEVLLDETLAANALRNVAGNSDDFQAMQSGLPMLLTEQGKLTGVPKNENELFELFERVLLIKPLESALE